MKKKKILLYMIMPIILAIFIIGGCNKPANLKCSKPYILVGNSCCLDQNSNNICDTDEKPAQQSFDSNKVIINVPTKNIDVYYNANGGLAQVSQNLIIRNDNDMEITVQVGFSPSNVVWFASNNLNEGNGGCRQVSFIEAYPNFDMDTRYVGYIIHPVYAHSTLELPLTISSLSSCADPKSFRDVTPSASSLKTSTTLKVKLIKKGDQTADQMLSSQLFSVTLHCINTDGTDNCQKLSQKWE